MTKILVTGGAGFIGAYLCNRLHALGHSVVVLDALRPYAWPHDVEHARERSLRSALIDGAAFEEADLLDPTGVEACLSRHEPDIVVHLAANAILSSAERDPARCEADIVASTRNLIKALRTTGTASRLVHASSSMVYGNFLSQRVGEDQPVAPINAYGRMKAAAEQLSREQAAAAGLEITVVRPIAVYGPGDFCRRVVTRFCAQALAGETLVVNDSPDQLMDFTFVEDVAEGMARAALRPEAAGQTFNIARGEARSLLDVIEALKRHVPGLRYQVTASPEVNRPKRGALDISKARELLGYEPRVGLGEGVEHCLAFLSGKTIVPVYEPEMEAAE